MKNKKRYDKKPNRIVQDRAVLEKITFQGKQIIREAIVKEWNIPDIITEDIGYELMFGNSPSTNRNNLTTGIEELCLIPQLSENRY